MNGYDLALCWLTTLPEEFALTAAVMPAGQVNYFPQLVPSPEGSVERCLDWGNQHHGCGFAGEPRKPADGSGMPSLPPVDG